LTCVVLGWGVWEAHGATAQYRQRNIERDQFVPVARRLTTLAAEHGRGPNDREMVFSLSIPASDDLAALAPQAPLFATHLPFASGLSQEEQQHRYFHYLY